MTIVVIGIYLGFKREFLKLIDFFVLTLVAVGLEFDAVSVKDVFLKFFIVLSEYNPSIFNA